MPLWCRTVTIIAKKVFAFGKEYGTRMDLRCIAVEVVQCLALKIGNSTIVNNKIVSTPSIILRVVF